ncbi:MAG: 3-isopropylmalate dehydrogenase [Gemmatimonadota bacterium]
MHANIVVLPGDGIGPEVTRAAVRVLEIVAERWDHTFDFTSALIGGAAIDATGEPLPKATTAACSTADAVLLGAVGGPKWDAAQVRPESGLLAIRKQLGVFANLRPVKVHPAGARISPLRPERLENVDLVFVRELTGGIYFGHKSRQPDFASDVCTYTRAEIERVTRVAGALARQRRGKLTSIDKANVLETSRLWREVVTRVVREEFADLELEHLLVDSAAMQLLQRPAGFDVLLTENMFGDILTDEAAVLAGSIGLLPSASIGGGAGLYEPIHGSAPDIAGQGKANPIGAILSAALLLRHSLLLETEARAIEDAVSLVLDRGLLGAGTEEIAGAVAASLTKEEISHV